jgi:hypothetical protein
MLPDFHITTATTTTGMSNNDKEKERNKFQQLSGIMVVVDRNISLTPDIPGNAASICRRPCLQVMPRSSSKARIWFTTAVRRMTQRSRTR